MDQSSASKRWIGQAMALAAALLTLCQAEGAWAAQCPLERIEASVQTHGVQVVISAACVPVFNVLRLHEPPRLVIDVADSKATFRAQQLPVSNRLIEHIAAETVQHGQETLARIVIQLRSEQRVQTVREGQDVVVTIEDAAAAEAASPEQAGGSEEKTQAAREATAEAPSASQEPGGPVRLLAISRAGEGALLRFDQASTHVVRELLRLEGPSRLVIDLPLAEAAPEVQALADRPSWLRAVRMAPRGGGLRVVFDLEGNASPTVTDGPDGIVVAQGSVERQVAEAGAEIGSDQATIEGIRLAEYDAGLGTESRVEFALAAEANVLPTLDTSNPRVVRLTLPRTRLGPTWLAGSRLESRRGPAARVVATAAPNEATEIAVQLRQASTADIEPTEAGLTLRLRPVHPREPSRRRGRAQVASQMHTAFADGEDNGDAKEHQERASSSRLAGKKISLDVKDADIVNVLRLISEETGENIITSDEVHGRVTLKLREVSAEQALDTLLHIKGLDRVRNHDILRIASAETIQKERDAEVARKRALIEVEEIIIKMVTINYATAAEVVDQLKPMLSGRGSVQVDSRTNTLIIQDIRSNIDNLAELARRLDKQTPLVNIQARIVEADSTFVRDLGVQWGGAVKHTAVTGNPTGLYFPADITAQGTADVSAGAAAGGAAAAPSRYAVNLPAALTGSGAALGFILGSAGGSQLLDLRLSAMETNGNGKVISSPEVSTLDNRTARVSQGVSFAVSTVSAAGTNVRFVPAVLQLEVTPHVTNDGTVLLKLHVQKSAPDFANRSGAGDPSIQTKEAETEVLVRDGDTSVIGGILTRTTTESRNEVPFFSKIPLLGLLFREHAQRDVRSELLVFITPRIINRDESKLSADSLVHSHLP